MHESRLYVSIFIALFSSRSICQMLVNFFERYSKGLYLGLKTKVIEHRCLPPQNAKFGKFHVVFVQRQHRNVKKV